MSLPKPDSEVELTLDVRPATSSLSLNERKFSPEILFKAYQSNAIFCCLKEWRNESNIMARMSGMRQIVPARTNKPQERSGYEHPCRVYVHNDDVTPMDFVIHVLTTVFLIPSPNADYIMYSAHMNGKSYVQTLPMSEARRRIAKAHFAARLRDLPLEFSLETE